jgi:hypothetical protein
MSIVEKVDALMAGTPENDTESMPPAGRQKLAQVLHHLADLADASAVASQRREEREVTAMTGLICGALGLAAGFCAGILLAGAGPEWEHGSAGVLWWSGAAFWAVMVPALVCITIEAIRVNREKRRRQEAAASIRRLAGLHDGGRTK